ncbi:MAG: putative solute-binding protein [Agitococcus sp.]
MWTKIAALIQIFCLLAFSVRAGADDTVSKRILCVWDLMGANGDNYSLMKDYRLAAKEWNVNLQLKAYTDEKIATEDFRVGQCDGVVITGLRAKPFNTFVGSLESIGAIPTYQHLRMVIAAISSPKAASLMSQDAYEVAGVMPLGSAYLFLRDRSIDEVGKLAGKKIAVFDYDKSQSQLVRGVGAQAVPSDISNFAAKFNNGVVDVIAAPATAYRPLELYRGLGEKGGIPDFLVAQVFLQVVIRKDRFPEGFGQKSRTYLLSQLERVLSAVERYEKDIDPKYWLHIPDEDRPRYITLMRDARIKLTKDGIYDKRMMSLLKRVRCQVEPSNAECSQNLE